MIHLSEWTFRRRAIIWFLLFSVLFGGILAFRSISKLEDPEITVMQAQVVTAFPGASAHEVEMQVTNTIESALNTLEDVETIRSRSLASLSVITITLEMTVPQKEIEQRWDFLRRRINEVGEKLPEGAQKPDVYDDFGDVYGMFYAMRGDGFSYKEMSRMARFIREEMLSVKGVGKVEIYGEQQPVAKIVFSAAKMGVPGVSPYQIMAAVREQNATVYPGVLYAGDQLPDIEITGEGAGLQDLKDLPVKSSDGSLIPLADMATVQEGYREPLRNTFSLNNEKALGISISMESGENIIEVGKRVDQRLTELQKNIPAGYTFDKVFFQPGQVKESIDGFMLNLAVSVLVVILVLMMSMGLRSGFIIGSGLLLTILATFPVLLAAGGTLQRISLGAFIVAMGMLVDNAVVVIDGILVDLRKGVKRRDALVNSGKRTAVPLLGATFIAVAAFLPVFLSEDAAGTYAHDLFLVLCISLFISWALALTQVPLFSEKLLKRKEKKENVPLYQGWGYRKFRKILSFLLHYKTATLIVSVLLLALAALNYQHMKKTFFPDFKYRQVYIEYELPAGTSPDKVREDLQQITRYLLSLEEVDQVASSQGMTPARYCLVRSVGEAADFYGELIVDFEDYSTMMRMKPHIKKYLHDNFPDAYTRIRKYNLSIKASHTVEVEFTGPDPAILRDLSGQAEEVFRKNPYVDPYTICNDWQPSGHVFIVRYLRPEARRAGVSRSDVSNAILAATGGIPLGTYFEGETRVDIYLEVRNSDGSRIEDLEDVPVWSRMPDLTKIDEQKVKDLLYGRTTPEELKEELFSPVPLAAVMRTENPQWEEQVVRRVNGQRAIQAQCEPLEGYSPAKVRKAALKQVADISLPEGYQMRWVGEQELQGDALRNIFRFLPFSVMLIILTLILLFNDFRKPLIVLICIPMAFTGIVPGMILTGQPFTFMAIVGSFGLMGMIVKNAIVLIDEVEREITGGNNQFRAVITATISRTRPVLLASFTTIFGMLPLLTDPMYKSMAVAIISGLLVGTLITLLFVPILYAVFFKINTVHEQTEVTDKL